MNYLSKVICQLHHFTDHSWSPWKNETRGDEAFTSPSTDWATVGQSWFNIYIYIYILMVPFLFYFIDGLDFSIKKKDKIVILFNFLLLDS